MSQQPISTRSTLPAPPPSVAPRPSLRVVTAPPRTAGRAPFVVLCSVLMTLGLLALLALNLGLASGSYALHDISARAEVLRAEQSELEERLALEQTPARLAARATELGMVTSGTPAYLRLSDGAIIGEATPAPTPTPSEGDEAAAGASGSASPASERGSGSAATVADKPGAEASGTKAAESASEPSARGSATARSADSTATSGTATTR